MRVPAKFIKKGELKKMQPGRRYKKGKTYVRKEGGSLHVTPIGRSLKRDRHKKVKAKRIPKTRGGQPKPGYGHRGDYPRKRR